MQNQYQPQYPNQSMQNSYVTQGSQQGDQQRRKYPKDIANKKSEYIALEKHKQEVNEELRKNEQEIKNIRSKEIQTQLDRKILEQLKAKQMELMGKHDDAVRMQQDMQQYGQLVIEGKQQNKNLQNMMSGAHQQQTEFQRQKQVEQRDQTLNWEQRLLEYNRERLESEARRRKQQKEYVISEKQEDLQRANYRHFQDRQEQLKNKEEYRDLCMINAEKEINKEQNYRNFYKLAAENQNSLQQQHFEAVMIPLLQRQKELEEIIAKNVNETLRRRAQEELNQILIRKSKLESTNEKNVSMMQEHQFTKEAEKVEKESKVKERLQDAKEKEYQAMQEKRMSKIEKGFNKMDLQAFKSVDPGLYTMLPGYSPQVGQLPPRQNRERIAELISSKIKQNPQYQDQNFNDQKIKQLEGEVQQGGSLSKLYARAAERELNIYNSVPSLKQFQKIGEAEGKFVQSSKMANKETMNNQFQTPQYRSPHNPITNSNPYYNQNPYIQKDLRSNGGNQNIFQQNGIQGQYR